MDEERMEALTALLNEIKIEDGRGWIKAVTPGEGKLFFHFDNFPVPVHDNPCIPFPERACVNIDEHIIDTMMNQAWARMAQMPLFTSIIMPVPTVATMMTGIPSRAPIDAMDEGIAELEELYAQLLREHGGDPASFCQTEEARKVIDGALLAVAKRDMQLRELNAQKPIGWEPIVTSASVYLYYARIIDIMSVTCGFSTRDSPEWEAQQKRIEIANSQMLGNIDKALRAAISNSELSSFITHARHNVAGSRFVGIDADKVCPLVERACIDFTYAVLTEMERWILALCHIPHELHASLMCAAQPKVGVRAGKLNTDGVHWQESLRAIREEAYPAIWHNFLFDEEFTDEPEQLRIDVPHLSRNEYKMNVFGALVRITYDTSTLSTLADQYTSRTHRHATLEELSPVLSDPLVIYDTQGGDHIYCSQVFKD